MIEQFDPLKGKTFRILDFRGKIDRDLEPSMPDAELKRLYNLMVTTRTADSKAFNLQRQGRSGTYAPSRGHEACQIGTAFAMKPGDWLFPYFRDLGMYLTLGYPLASYYQFWMGYEEGLRTPDDINIFPLTIPVASQIPHAVGAGLAARLRKLGIAIVTTFGDGATSEGDFHEALNMAGVFRTPNVFVCVNNQYAISVPRKKQSAAPTLAQKAVAYGFPGIQVDGNDIFAVYTAVSEALENARAGKGPTLIEAETYRLSDHTTSDDATKYRPKEETAEWEKKDPIERFRIYLETKGLWDETFEAETQKEATEFVEKAVIEAEARSSPAVRELFAHTYEIMPPELERQLAETESAGSVSR